MLRQCGVKSYTRVLLVRKLTIPESAKLLGVGETADNKEIKTAFLKKAKLFHPDNQDGGDAEKFKKLTKAKDVLENHQKVLATRAKAGNKYSTGTPFSYRNHARNHSKYNPSDQRQEDNGFENSIRYKKMKYDIYEAERRANWERERRKSVLLFFAFSFFLLQITISLISYTSDDKIIKRRFLQVATARRTNPEIIINASFSLTPRRRLH
ncbi:unnamed protein product [Oikopleura dioica]|uniref:J domain-containing protein n=1 Tax=Oikopleura dioica TaxID=34765 RepID=E4XMM0_OIKDI|nr:unnamed protein product [Oikopleura dioica]